jgi:hypothetical protein
VSLLHGQALNPALGSLKTIVHSIYKAQVKSAGAPLCRYTNGPSADFQRRRPVNSGDNGPDAVRMRVAIGGRAVAQSSDVRRPGHFRGMERGDPRGGVEYPSIQTPNSCLMCDTEQLLSAPEG